MGIDNKTFNNEKNQNQNGTGLGLSISQQLLS